jgi:ATP-dependent Clp protease protease subunit
MSSQSTSTAPRNAPIPARTASAHLPRTGVLTPEERSTRTVWLEGEVNSKSSVALMRKLDALEALDSTRPVILCIDSPGGVIDAGMAIADTITHLKVPVYAWVRGIAASMGAVILAVCEKGHRYALPSSRVLLHQPLGGNGGPTEDMIIRGKVILQMKEDLLRLLAERTGKPYEQVVADCDRDHWMKAPEALAYGIVDHIGRPGAV